MAHCFSERDIWAQFPNLLLSTSTFFRFCGEVDLRGKVFRIRRQKYVNFMFHFIFYHNNGKNKFMVRRIHSNIEHKLHKMVVMMMTMTMTTVMKGVMMTTAKYCAEEGRRGCCSRSCCPVLSWLAACFEALGLCRC